MKFFLPLFCFLLCASIFSSELKVIHIFVALCDNKNQGIVPVPEKLGNGEDLVDNLYWGAAYGVKSFFKKDKDWQLVLSSLDINEVILERVIFLHKTKNTFLVADAYRGIAIKQAIQDFVLSSNGEKFEFISIKIGKEKRKMHIGIGANANLIGYVGHNGLMDFSLDTVNISKLKSAKPIIVLACYSKNYFSKIFDSTKIKPILWTNGLLAPEAYVLKAGIQGWLNGETEIESRERAAQAYNHFQKCGLKGSRKLFSSGW